MTTVAIVGSGIAGLGCAHFLQHDYDITVYESDTRVGGHSYTVEHETAGASIKVDTGFMVFNYQTYPNLTRLFAELQVPVKKTDMSFSVQHPSTGLEYNGGSLNLLFVQRRNLLRLRHWKMLLAINRFNDEAVSALEEPRWQHLTLREYVRQRGYGDDMYHLYLVPMSSAVWSTPPGKMGEFPAMTLLRFWHNHGFLGLKTQHQWWTVDGGSREYVQRLTAPFHPRIKTGQRVASIRRHDGPAILTFDDGSTASYDKVVLACHGDDALKLLADPTELELRLLSPFKYQANTATLHTWEGFMPKRRACWAAWNYRLESTDTQASNPAIHYWMNRLQGLASSKNYFVSLNCAGQMPATHVIKDIPYHHPLFDLAAIAAQAELPSLNHLHQDQSTYFAGAWFKYGFHEDGFTSGLDCARAITRREIWP